MACSFPLSTTVLLHWFKYFFKIAEWKQIEYITFERNSRNQSFRSLSLNAIHEVVSEVYLNSMLLQGLHIHFYPWQQMINDKIPS